MSTSTTGDTPRTARNETTIEASKEVPTITIVREFDAPRALVWRAWTEPDLVARWMGPRDIGMEITTWELRRGGSWAYTARGDDSRADFTTTFYGSFHDVREPERLVQTFTWEGEPDGVSLETLTLEELPGGRTRTVARSVVESFEIRDMILASGMDTGVVQGYEQLDELLTTLG